MRPTVQRAFAVGRRFVRQRSYLLMNPGCSNGRIRYLTLDLAVPFACVRVQYMIGALFFPLRAATSLVWCYCIL